jgi:hypothetical protein
MCGLVRRRGLEPLCLAALAPQANLEFITEYHGISSCWFCYERCLVEYRRLPWGDYVFGYSGVLHPPLHKSGLWPLIFHPNELRNTCTSHVSNGRPPEIVELEIGNSRAFACFFPATPKVLNLNAGAIEHPRRFGPVLIPASLICKQEVPHVPRKDWNGSRITALCLVLFAR